MRFIWMKGCVFPATFLIALLSLGCKGKKNCVPTPSGPSCVYGKVDENNPLPGPGEGVRAAGSFAVYAEDCAANWRQCSRGLLPTDDSAQKVPDTDQTFVLSSYAALYTAVVCAEHPRVPGRKITLRVTAGVTSARTVQFDEADPAWQGESAAPRAKVCIATSFNMTFPSGGVINQVTGEASMVEDSQDLFTPTTWRQRLGFKVAR